MPVLSRGILERLACKLFLSLGLWVGAGDFVMTLFCDINRHGCDTKRRDFSGLRRVWGRGFFTADERRYTQMGREVGISLLRTTSALIDALLGWEFLGNAFLLGFLGGNFSGLM